MGLHLCYDLSLPAEMDAAWIASRLGELRDVAQSLPFREVSGVVTFGAEHLQRYREGIGLCYRDLEDVAQHAAFFERELQYRALLGLSDDDRRRVAVPDDLATTSIGFAISVGLGSEPAAFCLTQVHPMNGALPPWCGSEACKTQYASVLSDDHLLRCHGSLVTMLDAARDLGFGVEVRDQTGYWRHRDRAKLLEAVHEMNRIVARFAGAFTDAMRETTGDSRGVQGAIFDHPEFERLEGPDRGDPQDG